MAENEALERIWVTEFLDDQEPHFLITNRPHRKVPYIPERADLAAPVPADPLDKELGRWQDAIREHVIKITGAPDYSIDGAGCDSGDPLDLSLTEISQGVNFLIDKHETPAEAPDLAVGDWFYSGGNGVITICEEGKTDAITYLRPEQKSHAESIMSKHNRAVAVARRETWTQALSEIRAVAREASVGGPVALACTKIAERFIRAAALRAEGGDYRDPLLTREEADMIVGAIPLGSLPLSERKDDD